jgi:hypothetical protein
LIGNQIGKEMKVTQIHQEVNVKKRPFLVKRVDSKALQVKNYCFILMLVLII